MNQRLIGLAAAILVAQPSFALAAQITGISVSTNAGTDDGSHGGPIENMVNGSGLTGTGPSATHGNDPSTMWYSNEKNGAFLRFDLGATYELEHLGLYRYNTTLDPFAVVYRFDLSVSTDGVNFTRAFTYCCGSTVGVGKTDLDPEFVTFAPSTVARYVQFDDIENWGSPRIGLSEVTFSGANYVNVPEPTILALVTAAMVGIAATRRRSYPALGASTTTPGQSH